jgi:hypothetical protein
VNYRRAPQGAAVTGGVWRKPGGKASPEESGSFLKKRTKKLLSLWRTLPGRGATNSQKFFASFFQKRRPAAGALACGGHGLLVQCVAHRILRSADGILHLAAGLLGSALSLGPCVTGDLTNAFFHGTLDLMANAFDAILIHLQNLLCLWNKVTNAPKAGSSKAACCLILQ